MARSEPPAARPPTGGLYDPAFEHDACGVGPGGRPARPAQPHPRRPGPDRARAPGPPGRLGGRGGQRRRRRDPPAGAPPPPPRWSPTSTSRPPAATPSASSSCPATPTTRPRSGPRSAALAAEEGLTVLGWREVPIDDSTPGDDGQRAQPRIEQVFVAPADGRPLRAAWPSDRRAFVLRKRVEHAVDGRLLPVAVGPDPGLQGHAHLPPAARVLPRADRRPGGERPGPGALALLDQHLPAAGRWPTRTATWPTTARSTRWPATATGCGPARRCCASS